MRHLTLLSVCVCCFQITMSFAGVETFEVTYTYYLGDNETKLNAQEVALRYAEREALERAGVYIESITVIQDYELTKDEIKAYTAGLVELVNQSGEWDIEGANFVYRLTARFRIDTDDVARQIEAIRKDSELEKQLKESQKETERLYAELERVQADQKIIVSNAIRAVQLRDAVWEIITDNKYEYAEKALSMSKEVFNLEPYEGWTWDILADSYKLLYESHLTSKTEKDIIREIWLEAKSKDDVGLWYVLGRFILICRMNVFPLRPKDTKDASESLIDIGYSGSSRELFIYSLERGLNLICSSNTEHDIWPFIDMLNMLYIEIGNYERVIELASLGLEEGEPVDCFIRSANYSMMSAYFELGIYNKALKCAYEGKEYDLNNGGYSQDLYDSWIEDIKLRM